MGRPPTDLVGQRFGRLAVTAPHCFADGTRYSGRWVVQCDCGNIEDRSGYQLKSGQSRQCMPCSHKESRERSAAYREAKFQKLARFAP